MNEDIRTGRLVLEPLRVEHASFCFESLSDVTLYPFVPQDPPGSVRELRDRFQRLVEGAPVATGELWLNWFARLASSRTYVGYVQATVRPTLGTSLIAYQTFLPFRRQGYAAEACRAVVDVLVRSLGVAEVAAEIDTRNAASRRLVESLGFVPGPVREGADFFKGGRSDEITYRLACSPRRT